MRRALAMACALLLAGAADAHADRFKVTTNSYTFGQAPDWMPDGRVVFHDDFGDGQQVYVSALDGSGRRCLTCDMPGPNMVPGGPAGRQADPLPLLQRPPAQLGAPGFGGIGSDLWVMTPTAAARRRLTTSEEGHDNFHAYWSPDGNQDRLDHAELELHHREGNGKSDIRVADFVDDGQGPPSGERARHPPGQRPLVRDAALGAQRQRLPLHRERRTPSVNNELFFCRPARHEPRFSHAADGQPRRGTSRRSSRPT